MRLSGSEIYSFALSSCFTTHTHSRVKQPSVTRMELSWPPSLTCQSKEKRKVNWSKSSLSDALMESN